MQARQVRLFSWLLICVNKRFTICTVLKCLVTYFPFALEILTSTCFCCEWSVMYLWGVPDSTSCSCGAEKFSVTHPLPPLFSFVLFIEPFRHLAGGAGAGSPAEQISFWLVDFDIQFQTTRFIWFGLLRPGSWRGTHPSQQKGSNSCPSVLPLRFDFHDCIFSGRRFISRFGVCDVWVPRLCFLLFRQGLMKRANVDGVKSICGWCAGCKGCGWCMLCRWNL